MIEKILIEFKNGETWEVDPMPFAKERAEYYATSDLGESSKDSVEWLQLVQDEINHALSDDYDLLDYMKNNIEWSEIAPHAKKISEAQPHDFHATWYNDTNIKQIRTD